MYLLWSLPYSDKKTEKVSDEELESDLPHQLFSTLNTIKKKLVLHLSYQIFEKKCYIVNKILMKEKTFFRYMSLEKSFVF